MIENDKYANSVVITSSATRGGASRVDPNGRAKNGKGEGRRKPANEKESA